MKILVKKLSIVVLLVSVIVACHKKKDTVAPDLPPTPTPNTGDCRLVSVKIDTTETKLQYDASGKVVKAISLENDWPRWAISFEYSAGKITQRDSVAAQGSHVIDVLAASSVHISGANGYDSVYYIDLAPYASDTTFYAYNTNGYLTHSKHVHYQLYNAVLRLEYTEERSYTIQDGNITAETYVWLDRSNAPRTDQATYTYYADRANIKGMNMVAYYDYPFLGKKSASLLKKYTYVYGGDGRTVVSDYVYEFDADGKAVKSTETTVGAGLPTTTLRKLGYQCQ